MYKSTGCNWALRKNSDIFIWFVRNMTIDFVRNTTSLWISVSYRFENLIGKPGNKYIANMESYYVIYHCLSTIESISSGESVFGISLFDFE